MDSGCGCEKGGLTLEEHADPLRYEEGGAGVQGRGFCCLAACWRGLRGCCVSFCFSSEGAAAVSGYYHPPNLCPRSEKN